MDVIYLLLITNIFILSLLVPNDGIFLTNKGTSIIYENRDLRNKNDIILKCPYALEPNDERGLAIAWYYNDMPYPFYQWIPFTNPQAIDMFRNHLDLEYESSTEDYYKFRDIRFVSPVTNLTGRYSCKVSSFRDEKVYTMHLIVFSLPSHFAMNIKRRAEAAVTVICNVEFIYPEPRLHLYRAINNKRIPMENGELQTNWAEGGYNVSIEAGIEDIQLDGMTEFACHLDIPETNISMERAIKYLPRSSHRQNYNKMPSSSPSLSGHKATSYCRLIFVVILNIIICYPN